jgi:hypothetical protein
MDDTIILSLEHFNGFLGENHKLPFKKDKKNGSKLVGWLKKDDILHLIKISGSTCIKFISEFDEHEFRLVYSERTGITSVGETLQLVEILCGDEYSEEKEYRRNLSREANSFNHIEQDYSYSNQDAGIGDEFAGLTGEEAELARWNCD